jgi:ornithine cyclodeaminase/alanine dehydrogenase-like protein (mu-crystallin family)
VGCRGPRPRRLNSARAASTNPAQQQSALSALRAGEPQRGARSRARGRKLAREDVTELGAVLAGNAAGRRSDDEATVFDSTGLAIQDLAIALAAMEQADALDLRTFEL